MLGLRRAGGLRTLRRGIWTVNESLQLVQTVQDLARSIDQPHDRWHIKDKAIWDIGWINDQPLERGHCVSSPYFGLPSFGLSRRHFYLELYPAGTSMSKDRYYSVQLMSLPGFEIEGRLIANGEDCHPFSWAFTRPRDTWFGIPCRRSGFLVDNFAVAPSKFRSLELQVHSVSRFTAV